MKVIGAGLPRTATTTQLIALEMLGFPCYHMRDMMSDLATSVPQWRKALEGDGDWDELFEGKESIVDWPGSYHWRELMDVYPDAKVLLSVRDPESWVKSMHNTIAAIWFGDNLMHHLAMAQYHIDPLYAGWLDVLNDMWTKADIMVRSKGQAEEMAAGMKRWNEEVIDTVGLRRVVAASPDPDRSAIALLHGREKVDGSATAYVCRSFACRLPVTDATALAEQLAAAA